MKKSVTLKDIAEKVGVSAVTVSKALTNKDGVSEDMRARIKEIADELGYKYGSTAAVSNQSGIIGVIVEKRFTRDDCNTFYLKMYQNLVQVLSRFNYYGILEIVSASNESELVKPKLLEDKKVDGLIVLGQFKSPYVKMLTKCNVKMVLLDFYDKNCNVDAIISDSVYGSYRATNYLIENGHKEIGFVGNIFSTNSIMDRYMGYYKALLESKLKVDKNWVIDDRNEEGQYIPLELPEKEEMPSAFVCSCDEVCYLLVKQLENRGYEVPKDISVVGYDNFIFSPIPDLKLTTVEVDIEAMTESAVELILKKIRSEKHFDGMRIVESKLIIRNSVAKID